MDDRQLAAGIRRKEEKALDQLIDQYGRLIKSIVFYHLGDFYRDECINDILLCIWNHIDQYHPEKNSLKNWIGAICKYKCIDYKRKFYKENFVELDENIPVSDQRKNHSGTGNGTRNTNASFLSIPKRSGIVSKTLYQ